MPRFPLRVAYPFAEQHDLAAEVAQIRSMEIEWDLSYGATVRRGYLISLLGDRGLLDEFVSQHWPHGSTPQGQAEIRFCLKVRQRYEDFLQGYSDESEVEADLSEAASETQQFAAESDLRDYLSRNLHIADPGLRPYHDDPVEATEFPAGNGRIDILAVDPAGRPVVLELKVGTARPEVLGQLAYYMSWVDTALNLGRSRGIVVAKEISRELARAVGRVPDVSLRSYTLSVQLQKVGHD